MSIATMRPALDVQEEETLLYGFGHLVSSHLIDAHSADSGELARDVFDDLDLSAREVALLEVIAEHVADNYEYTGTGEATRRKIEAGEL